MESVGRCVLIFKVFVMHLIALVRYLHVSDVFCPCDFSLIVGKTVVAEVCFSSSGRDGVVLTGLFV